MDMFGSLGAELAKIDREPYAEEYRSLRLDQIGQSIRDQLKAISKAQVSGGAGVARPLVPLRAPHRRSVTPTQPCVDSRFLING